MRTSTASSGNQSALIELRVSQHRRITTVHRQSGLDQEELDRCEDDLRGCPEMEETEDKRVPLLAPPQIEGAVSVTRESVDKVSGAPLIGAHSDEDGPVVYTGTTGVGATQSIVAEREKTSVQVNTKVDGLFSGLLVDAPTDSYPKGPYDPNMEGDQVDMQVDFSISVDKDEDEVEPWFGLLPNTNTTLDPSLAFQPQLYNHGPSIEQDDRIVEEIGPCFVEDSVMEEARTEPWRADASVTATQTLQAFSLLPPSVSGAVHTIFPGVPFATPAQMTAQMTVTLDTSVPVFQHHILSDPYAVDAIISEETRLPQDTPPQDIAWPFIGGGVHPSAPGEVGLANEPPSVYARLSLTSVSSVFTSQITSHSSFPPPSLPASTVDPLPVSSSTCRHIEGHKEAVNNLEGEVDLEPAPAAAVQRESSPPRCV